MAQWETFNFNDERKRVPAAVLADSMRAIAEFLEAEGKMPLARAFVESTGAKLESRVVAPVVLEAACRFCIAQGEAGIAAALRERFLIRG